MERSDNEIRRYSLIFLRIDRVASLVSRAFSVFPRVSERLLRSFPSFVKKKEKERKGERKRGRGERGMDGRDVWKWEKHGMRD